MRPFSLPLVFCLVSGLCSSPVLGAERGYTAGRFALSIGNVDAGWVQSVEGGSAVSDVVSEKVGADHVVHKHIGGVKYEDITLNTGLGPSKGFYEWLSASLSQKHERKDGAIHACDYDGNIVSTLDFFHGLITEVGFPALDAGSKDAAKMTIKISPEYTRHKAGSGKVDPSSFALGKGEQKKWLPANFRLKLTDLEDDCKKVQKVDSITVKQSVARDDVGESRDYQKEPANLEIPNFTLSLPENSPQFDAWYNDFVVKGNNGQDREKTGTLEFLSSPGDEVLFTLVLKNVGIYRLERPKFPPPPPPGPQAVAGLYVEDVAFVPGPVRGPVDQFFGAATKSRKSGRSPASVPAPVKDSK